MGTRTLGTDLTNLPVGRPQKLKRLPSKSAIEVATVSRHDNDEPTTSGQADCGNGVPRWTSVSDFHISKKLGSTMMSTVFLGQCKTTGVLVAIKVYRKSSLDDIALKQVHREISALKMLRHSPYTNKLLASFEDAHFIRLILEYCPGGDIYNLKKSRGLKLSEPQVAHIISRLLLALQDCHEKSILHRDVKPENLFLDSQGQVQLGDFGLCICTKVSAPKSVVGTLDYIAPEVLRMSPDNIELCSEYGIKASKSYGVKADVWSVGVTAFELLLGRAPFELPSVKDSKKMIMAARLDFSTRHGLSADCVDFLRTVLAKDPQNRPFVPQLLLHPWIAGAANPSALGPASLDSRALGVRTLGSPEHMLHQSAPVVRTNHGNKHSNCELVNESLPQRFTKAVGKLVMYTGAWSKCLAVPFKTHKRDTPAKGDEQKGKAVLPGPLRAPAIHYMPNN